jgi:hypothetical protein
LTCGKCRCLSGSPLSPIGPQAISGSARFFGGAFGYYPKTRKSYLHYRQKKQNIHKNGLFIDKFIKVDYSDCGGVIMNIFKRFWLWLRRYGYIRLCYTDGRELLLQVSSIESMETNFFDSTEDGNYKKQGYGHYVEIAIKTRSGQSYEFDFGVKEKKLDLIEFFKKMVVGINPYNP